MTIRLLFAALLLVPVVSASQDTAESSLRLYVLDGGTLTNPDPSWAGVTVEDVKGFTSLPSPAFLIVHPSGTLLWDAGLGDHLLGRPLDENRRGPWGQVVTRSLRGQLEEVGYLPVDIDYLALSHLHFDHIGSASDYAASTWIVQQAEREASVPARDPLTERVYRRANEGETIALNGDHDVFGDGAVVIKSTPGHTVNSTGRRNTSMMRYCDAETETETVRPGGSACDAFAWSAAGNGACGAARVLEGDRAGAVE